VRALCDFAVKLTAAPATVEAADVDTLRAHGWDDPAIHDAIQVISYFNYINRVAEAVGSTTSPNGGRGRPGELQAETHGAAKLKHTRASK
jgi:uncharacterized peroxidase-related enzyme